MRSCCRSQAIDIVLAGNAILVSGTALYGPALDSGVPAGRCAGMVPGVTFSRGDATLKAIDAGRHTSNMVWKGQFCGGDCAISGDFKTWRELHAPQPGDPAPVELTRALAARGSGIEVITLEFGQTWTQPPGA